VLADEEYNPPDGALKQAQKLGQYRTVLVVPMMREGAPLGTLTLWKTEVAPFTEAQIELVKTFADQAVIAIENVRLFDELSESLEQQTATSEVLQVISSSPGELQPVFDAMLANATRICGAKFGMLYRREGDHYRVEAMHGVPPAYAEERQRQPLFKPPGALGRLASAKRAIHIADITKDESYVSIAMAGLAGARTLLTVPMLKDNEVIGAINIYRQEVRPFTDKQVELVSNFAKQAVIAIENTRLLNELRQRTDDLSESLEQQTATSEVLQVISSSPGELEPVFTAMLANATRICGAKFGVLWLTESDGFARLRCMVLRPPLSKRGGANRSFVPGRELAWGGSPGQSR
jgi:GAF domain-containing protein